MCHVFDIIATRDYDMVTTKLDYGFDLSVAQEAKRDILLTDLGWTLYSFDFKASEAVFLDIGPDCDVSKAPFSFLEQRATARRLARLSFSEFIELAGRIHSTQPVIHLFNTGHCGSTLLHHAFNRAQGVWCISEPQFTFDAAMKREGTDDATVALLLAAGLKFLSRFPKAHSAEVMIVKHFSQATRLFAIYDEINSEAKNIFMYRDGESWCQSVFRFAQRMGAHFALGQQEREFVWWIMSGDRPVSDLEGIVDMTSETVRFDDLAAVCWYYHMLDFANAPQKNVLPLRYNELEGDRIRMITKIFASIGISGDPDRVLEAFEQDSHEGTRTARSHIVDDFTAENFTRVREIFDHPKIKMAGQSLLPNTLKP